MDLGADGAIELGHVLQRCVGHCVPGWRTGRFANGDHRSANDDRRDLVDLDGSVVDDWQGLRDARCQPTNSLARS